MIGDRHCHNWLVVYKLWRCVAFSWLLATHLYEDADSIPGLHPTDIMMSSVTPQRFDNDGPQPYMVILGQDGYVLWLAYLPDGRRVVTGSHKTVRVWNLESGKQEGAPMEHENGMSDLAVTRDGTKIVSSDNDGRIGVWDVGSHKLVREWTHPERFPINGETAK